MSIPIVTAHGIPFLQGLDDGALNDVAKLMVLRSYAVDETALAFGEVAQDLCFILNGKFQRMQYGVAGRETGVSLLEAGQHFGILSVSDRKPSEILVVAVRRSLVAALPATAVRTLFIQHPSFAERYLAEVATIARQSADQNTLLTISNAFQRVYCQLRDMMDDTETGIHIPRLPRQQEIATMVNTSRETVSRAMQNLLRKEILKKEGGSWIVKRPDLLQEAANTGLH